MLHVVAAGVVLFSPFQGEGEEEIPTVVIDSEQNASPFNPYEVVKSERVYQEKFKEPGRQTVADLVEDQPGVEAQTYCSNCGAKRVTINGLKGEHTSILVDGLPLHSAVSSFYGVDSIPVNGIGEIEVMRGTGASLANPEAIGGTIHLLTLDPLIPRQSYSISISVNDALATSAQNHAALATFTTENKKFGVTVGGQMTRNNPWDEEKNAIAESPRRDNLSALLKARYLPTPKNDLSLRWGISDLTILGGATEAVKPTRVRTIPIQESDFENASVEQRFVGDPAKITDWISLRRYEGALLWTHYLSNSMTLAWNSGYARQEQASIYQHGFDYAHNDNLFVTDLSLQWLKGQSHVLKSGLFFKNQRLRSASEVLFQQNGIPKDNFDHTSLAAYLKYSYIHSEKLEMDFAARADQIHMNWLELSNAINRFVLAPRYQVRHNFNDYLSQRFSYGLGYRTPLTFFESQHGNNENGYKIDITELETAHSFVYSLSFNTPTYYLTGGAHYTHLRNMAYGFESQGQPTLYRNTEENFGIWAADVMAGYQVKPGWMIEASAEFFRYQDSYTKKLPTAAIENRYQLRSNLEWGSWTHSLTATLVGSRDLSRYGSYSDHYVDRNQFPGPETRGNNLKDQRAPAFVVFDTSLSYKFKSIFELTFGISNLLNQTQVGRGDNPSAWHWHFDHAHYDGLHTWGPNRGREFYLKLAADL